MECSIPTTFKENIQIVYQEENNFVGSEIKVKVVCEGKKDVYYYGNRLTKAFFMVCGTNGEYGGFEDEKLNFETIWCGPNYWRTLWLVLFGAFLLFMVTVTCVVYGFIVLFSKF
ncbi:hypothetical protein MHBO_000440 [Bonamia ostreae]|uniref:S-protein homolog n=1 Tax=Bonamia ostreae TaxID=126728 RepID=A0ABV2AFP7_9EUKA